MYIPRVVVILKNVENTGDSNSYERFPMHDNPNFFSKVDARSDVNKLGSKMQNNKFIQIFNEQFHQQHKHSQSDLIRKTAEKTLSLNLKNRATYHFQHPI